MRYHVFSAGPLDVNCTIIIDENSGEAIVVDPGGNFQAIQSFLDDHQLKLVLILATHGHFDHVGAVSQLKKSNPDARFGIHQQDEVLAQNADKTASIYGIPTTPTPSADFYLNAETTLQLGSLNITVIETPGHTQGGVCFYLDEESLLLSGDTLFQGSVGRTDLPGGDHDQLLHSISSRLLPLPDEVTVIPGHGPRTTIRNERNHNPFFQFPSL
ncbi:MBL fold metallo-hydrolase [Desulfurispira natronophila]|uniref:Glyoxylase-like metal-dependent hydrolase (Beta-lactamase superfamily II) n=1 Tax=Desulfurispira natronophila TaxID=682562 RepID=A0A7W7Y686_9BACT|nr:MBL fold metallo-hydrolase [Desulfurispira natronophila]MBB5022762.1 glyoxylase-like metal-dependent hydrolase (beta-lactamase superfamily II) [Desulfurispira natronophila]